MKRPVYEIDGALFYEGVIGDPHALHDLFMATTDMLNASGQKIPGSVVEYYQAMYDRYMPPSETLESVNL